MCACAIERGREEGGERKGENGRGRMGERAREIARPT